MNVGDRVSISDGPFKGRLGTLVADTGEVLAVTVDGLGTRTRFVNRDHVVVAVEDATPARQRAQAVSDGVDPETLPASIRFSR